jgi:Tol biopolymer transport system component
MEQPALMYSIRSSWRGSMVLTGFVLAMPAMAASTLVTLSEGSNLSVSAPAGDDRLAFDLAGRIWVMSTADGMARALTGETDFFQRPAFSPDGRFIAFETRRGGFYQIMLMDADGNTPPRQITFGDFDHRTPAWSPDSTRVLMASDRTGDYGIWELAPETLSLTQLTFRSGDERDPAWNADGSLLAFVTDVGQVSALFIQPAGARAELLIREQGRIYSPSWRPDNSVLTYVLQHDGISELRMVIRSNPPVSKPVTSGERVFPGRTHWLDRDRFIYAADGRIRERGFGAVAAREIPFGAAIEIKRDTYTPVQPDFDQTDFQPVRGITGLAVTGPDELTISAMGDLWSITRDGELLEQLTNDSFVDAQPAISPDGSKLAFVSDRGGDIQVWLLNRSDGHLEQLTHEQGLIMHPRWNGASDSLVYLVANNPIANRFTLRKISLAADQSESMPPETLITGLIRPSAPDWHPDHGIVMAVGQMQRSGESDPRRSRLIRITSLNDPGNGSTIPLPRMEDKKISAPLWSSDGQQLLFLADQNLMLANVNDRGDFEKPRVIHAGPVNNLRWGFSENSIVFSAEQGLVFLNSQTGDSTTTAIPLSWRPEIPTQKMIIRAGKIYDGIAPQYLINHEIVIDGNRITAVRPWTDEEDGFNVIDAREHTVMPGLIDLAVTQQPVSNERLGHTWLAFGITSIRENVTWPTDAIERHESWRRGQRIGPRLFISRQLCPAQNISAEQAENLVADAATMNANSITGCITLSGNSQAKLIAAAHARGLPFISPAPFPGLALGADEVPMVTTRGALSTLSVYGDVLETVGITGTAVVSRLGPVGLADLARHTPIMHYRRYLALYPKSERLWYSAYLQSHSSGAQVRLSGTSRSAAQSLFLAVGRGGRIVPGSGSPATPYGLGLHAELQLLVGTGLQPFQVLRMATLDAARALGVARDLGSVEPGKLADLIIVAGDPLADISHAADVRTTIVGGQTHMLEKLLQPSKTVNSVGNIYNSAHKSGF